MLTRGIMKKNLYKSILIITSLFLSACTRQKDMQLSDGIFTGHGAGRNGPIVVEVSISNGKVSDAKIIEESETEEIGKVIEQDLIDDFVSYGSPDALDAVTGATLTSRGLMEALQDALDVSRGKREASVEYKDSETDLVIIGAGGAGLTAATEAALHGAKVIVLEKAGIVGGNTNSATGGLNASQTSVQKKLGIKDTNEQFYADTMKGGHYKNDSSLVKTMVERSSEIVDWLQSSDVGADLSDVGLMGGSTNRRTHRPVGGQAIGSHLVPRLYASAKAAGAEIRLNSAVIDILSEDGKAAGVLVKNEAGTYKIKAKAVIIATGGFGANFNMISRYRPDLEGFATTNVKTTTGDAFEWLEKFGAKLRLMEEIQIHPTVVPNRGILITEAIRGNGAIMISKSGKRFVNELDTRDVTSKAVLALPEKRAYIFFNQEVRNSLKAVENYEKQGLLIKGKSIKDIAGELKIDSAVLEKTLADYNLFQKTGIDKDFSRNNMAVSLEKGPYYAVEIEPAIHHTMGGVVINSKAQVLNGENQIIPNLYAAGEVTGGVHGDNRLGGNSIADITIFGKIAADSALEQIFKD